MLQDFKSFAKLLAFNRTYIHYFLCLLWIDLNKALSAHCQHKQDDRDYISTMVLKQASPLHRSRSYIEPACFILEEGTNRCIYYQDIPPVNERKTSVDIDRSRRGEEREREILSRVKIIRERIVARTSTKLKAAEEERKKKKLE